MCRFLCAWLVENYGHNSAHPPSHLHHCCDHECFEEKAHAKGPRANNHIATISSTIIVTILPIIGMVTILSIFNFIRDARHVYQKAKRTCHAQHARFSLPFFFLLFQYLRRVGQAGSSNTSCIFPLSPFLIWLNVYEVLARWGHQTKMYGVLLLPAWPTRRKN